MAKGAHRQIHDGGHWGSVSMGDLFPFFDPGGRR